MQNELRVLTLLVNHYRNTSGLAVNLEVDCQDETRILYRLSLPVLQWRSEWDTAFDVVYWKARQFLLNGAIND